MNYSSVMKLPECYKILNVSPGVKWDEIKKSYRVLALKFHPDHHPGIDDFENRFKEISRAFKTLESYYQTSGIEAREYHFEPSAAAPVSEEEVRAVENETGSDRLALFKSFLNRPVNRQLAVDITKQTLATLAEWETKLFLLNVQKEIRVDAATVEKGGVVKVRRNKETFEVPIPPGAWNRMTLRIAEKGEANWFRKKRGDLLLDINVISSANTACAGDRNLYYDFPVEREKVENGKMLTLNTVQGIIKFVLPRKTDEGQSFVLKASPKSREAMCTNHIVKVRWV
ncbi:hypothetical protein UZ36_06845 [Candidatus Nitromaritima sp. SCGC AAA799-C22]|nr:hypothetical protein UZ36_06845 [Candidatus Nitromaritima sp. SCGC AAA799-C22]